MLLFIFILFILGTIFGSFATVLIERWHSGKGGILLGRSECPHCHHTLTSRELVPIFSYLFQKGKCRNCHTRIPFFYPMAELLMGVIFMNMGIVLFLGKSELGSIEIFSTLALGFVTGVYILYDARHMEIPDQIMVPSIFIILILLLGSLFFPSLETIFFDRYDFISIQSLVTDHLIAAWLLYSFFYIQILLPGGAFLLKKKHWKKFGLLCISYFTFPFELLISLFHKKNTRADDEEEIPTWIGGGDLRIALFIGLTLGILHGIFAFFCAYIIGSIVGVILLIKNGRKNSQIAFGPFLGIGWVITMLLYQEVLDLFQLLFV